MAREFRINPVRDLRVNEEQWAPRIEDPVVVVPLTRRAAIIPHLPIIGRKYRASQLEAAAKATSALFDQIIYPVGYVLGSMQMRDGKRRYEATATLTNKGFKDAQRRMDASLLATRYPLL